MNNSIKKTRSGASVKQHALSSLVVVACLLAWSTSSRAEDKQATARIEVKIVDGGRTITAPVLTAVLGREGNISIENERVVGNESVRTTLRTGTFVMVTPSMQEGQLVLDGRATLTELLPDSEQHTEDVAATVTESRQWTFRIRTAGVDKWYSSTELRKGCRISIRARLQERIAQDAPASAARPADNAENPAAKRCGVEAIASLKQAEVGIRDALSGIWYRWNFENDAAAKSQLTSIGFHFEGTDGSDRNVVTWETVVHGKHTVRTGTFTVEKSANLFFPSTTTWCVKIRDISPDYPADAGIHLVNVQVDLDNRVSTTEFVLKFRDAFYTEFIFRKNTKKGQPGPRD